VTDQNVELLAILKALTEKIENLERTVYHQDNLLMKSGLVVAESPSPKMNNGGVGSSLTILLINSSFFSEEKLLPIMLSIFFNLKSDDWSLKSALCKL